jgi:hypothetical protein
MEDSDACAVAASLSFFLDTSQSAKSRGNLTTIMVVSSMQRLKLWMCS